MEKVLDYELNKLDGIFYYIELRVGEFDRKKAKDIVCSKEFRTPIAIDVRDEVFLDDYYVYITPNNSDTEWFTDKVDRDEYYDRLKESLEMLAKTMSKPATDSEKLEQIKEIVKGYYKRPRWASDVFEQILDITNS